MPVALQYAFLPFPGIQNLGSSPECRSKKLNNKECRAETWLGLSELIQEGVIRDAGVSNFNVNHLKELERLREKMSVAKPAVNQIKFNPWAPAFNQEVFEYCQTTNLPVVAYSSLGMAMQKKTAADSKVINKIAKQVSKTPQQVLLRWALQKGAHNSTAVIPGTSKRKHMESNLAAYSFQLNDTQMKELNALKNAEEAREFIFEQWPSWV